MIEFLNVCKSFGSAKLVADHITFTVNDGEIFGFLGPNGAGKTTLIRMMTGILKPDVGKIRFNGIDATLHPIEAKKALGYVSDNPDHFLRLKGIEYLNFMADMYDVSYEQRGEAIASLATEYEMQEVLGDTIQSYSHGMRQKIVVIGALLHDPDIWILDEPLTGLDPKSAYILKHKMQQHADANKTVFFSTHVLEVAENLCNRVAIINHGQIIFAGSMKNLKNQYKDDGSLEKIFLEMTDHE